MSETKVEGLTDRQVERFEKFFGTLNQYKTYSRAPNAQSEIHWLATLERFTESIQEAIAESKKAPDSEFHLFTDGTDTISAQSVEDALCFFMEYSAGDIVRDCDPFLQVPDDQLESLVWVDDNEINYSEFPVGCAISITSLGRLRVTATAAAWAEKTGRGMFTSSEWT